MNSVPSNSAKSKVESATRINTAYIAAVPNLRVIFPTSNQRLLNHEPGKACKDYNESVHDYLCTKAVSPISANPHAARTSFSHRCGVR